MSNRNIEKGCFQLLFFGSIVLTSAYLLRLFIDFLLDSTGYAFYSSAFTFIIAAIILAGLLFLGYKSNSILKTISTALDFYFRKKNIKQLEHEYEIELQTQKRNLKDLLNNNK